MLDEQLRSAQIAEQLNAVEQCQFVRNLSKEQEEASVSPAGSISLSSGNTIVYSSSRFDVLRNDKDSETANSD